jgi:hypothetical protein
MRLLTTHCSTPAGTRSSGALIVGALVPLTITEPVVVEAAARIGVNLPRASTRTTALRH